MLVVRQPDDLLNPLAGPVAVPEALERGDLSYATLVHDFTETEWDFLRHQECAPSGQGDLALDCATNRLCDHHARGDDEVRLQDLLQRFSATTTRWLQAHYPYYAAGLVADRVTLRTEEEATRPGPHSSRIDLLHIDSSVQRPSLGRRILRVCVNINPNEQRIWATAGRFPELLVRYATKNKVPVRTRDEWIAPPASLLRLFTGERGGRPAYDAMMLRLHHFLKEDDEYQTRAARKLWSFDPGMAWLMFTDGTAYAQLRGRYALEHTFFVPHECLALPDESPLSLLEKFGSDGRMRRAS